MSTAITRANHHNGYFTQTQAHGLSHQQSQHNGLNQQELAKLLVQLILQQMMQATGQDQSGNDATSAVGKTGGAKSAQGANSAKGSNSDTNAQAVLQQFMELLQLFSALLGNGSQGKTNGLASKIADGLPSGGTGSLDQLGQDNTATGSTGNDLGTQLLSQILQAALGNDSSASGQGSSQSTGSSSDFSEIAKQLVQALMSGGSVDTGSNADDSGTGGLSQQIVSEIAKLLIQALLSGDTSQLDKLTGAGGAGGTGSTGDAGATNATGGTEATGATDGNQSLSQDLVSEIAKQLVAALLSGNTDGANGAGQDGGNGKSSGLSKDQITEIVKQLVEALLSGDSSKLGQTSDAASGTGTSGTNATDSAVPADTGTGNTNTGLSSDVLELLKQLVEALLAQKPKSQDNSQPSSNNNDTGTGATTGTGSVPGTDKTSKSAGAPTPSIESKTDNTTATAASPSPGTPSVTTTTAAAGSTAHSVQEAAHNTKPSFKPVIRGDEEAKDKQIKTQEDFARAADQAARDYGIDPNAFRAQLQAESGAFTQDYKKAMKAEGDLDRKGDNNTSIGLGQISRKYLDNQEWADGGPGNARVGKQTVTTEQYMNSPTVQLRMAASNLAQRVADHGGLAQGLAYYVSGNSDTNNASAKQYLSNIDLAMKDPKVVDVGR